MSQNEETIVAELRGRLENNLAEVKYTGPQRVFGGEVVTLLIELILDVLSSCLGAQAPGQTVDAARIIPKRVSLFQKVRLKRELRKQVYQGSRFYYQENEGDKVLEAVIKTVESSSDIDKDALMSCVQHTERSFGSE